MSEIAASQDVNAAPYVVSRYGFTGSSTKTTPPQRASFTSWISAHAEDIEEFDHGDCIEADAFAHDIVREFTKAFITIHPPTKDDKRAFKQGDHEFLPKPYLERNKDVVLRTEAMLAMPDGLEKSRSGTWSTIRYALHQGKGVVTFWPDGTITSTPPKAANHAS